jgi:hypothetical protein
VVLSCPCPCLVLSCLVLSCLVLSCLVLSCLVLVLSLSCPCLVLVLSSVPCPCLVLVLSLSCPCLVLSCLVLVLSCLVLSCLVLSCLAQVSLYLGGTTFDADGMFWQASKIIRSRCRQGKRRRVGKKKSQPALLRFPEKDCAKLAHAKCNIAVSCYRPLFQILPASASVVSQNARSSSAPPCAEGHHRSGGE